MTFLSLRNHQKRLQRPAPVSWHSRRSSRAAPSIRPLLERLEDRITPTVFTPTVFTDGVGDGTGTLRQAVIDANNDAGTATDTIQLSAGTYVLNTANTAANHDVSSTQGDLNITNAAHALIIEGATDANGNPTTIIDQTVADRVFQILNLTNPGDAAATVTFKNLIIEGGKAQDDGAAGAVAGQSDALGGGILNGGGDTALGTFVGGNVTLSNVVVRSNQAMAGTTWSAQGGGVYSVDGSLSINHSTIQMNSAIDGGGDNTAGGGVAFVLNALSSPQLSIANSTVAHNNAQGSGGFDGGGDGGGVYSAANTTTITASTLANNTASNSGGGAALFGSITIVNSTIAGNTAGDQGGGIFFEKAATGQLTNDTVFGNQGGASGGLDNNNGDVQPVTLVNTVVAANTLTNNTGVPSQDLTAQFLSGGHNFIGIDNNFKGATDQAGTAASPLNPNLGPLQNNGGPTATLLPLAGSPLLGAGDPGQAPATDQRGVSRPAGGPIDIGAVQVSGTSSGPTAPPALHTPFLLAFFDQFPGVISVETVNANGTVTVTDSFFGIPFLVSTYSSAGSLMTVLYFGFDVTALFI